MTGFAERRRSGNAAWVTRTMPVTFVSRTVAMACGVRSSTPYAAPRMPALLTRTSSSGSAANAASTDR